jgi:hypothetical protein
MFRVTTGVTVYGDKSITLPRFVNGSRVREATFMILGTNPLGHPTYQKMRVPFLSPSQISLVARYYQSGIFQEAASGQQIKVLCPVSGSASISLFIINTHIIRGSLWNYPVNNSVASSYFSYSGTVNVNGGVASFSPGAPLGESYYSYKNIDSSTAVIPGQWGLGCL